jgi:signal transduction histidine kinase
MMLITFTIGGHILISSLFESAYEREIHNAKEENKLLQYSIAASMSALYGRNKNNNEDMIKDFVTSSNERIQSENTEYRLSDQNKELLYSSKFMKFDQKLLDSIASDVRGYTILQKENHYFIQTACMLTVEEQSFYLESFRDITSIYQERSEQYDIYKRLLLGLIIINGIISYIISLWLTYPIKKVSRAAHKITKGNLNARVKIKSDDEIGRLAQNFNQMTDSLEKKIEELKCASQRQEDFIGSFAHELKTPLTSIIGYADILRSNRLNPEMTVMSANYIFKEGMRLEALSLKLLELIVMQKQELELKKVKITQLLEEVRGIILPILAKEDITLEIAVSNGYLMIEPDLIKTVLINVIDNGKKAMDGAGKITVLGRKEDGGYGIYIRDSGKGMKKEELSRITEAFYMVDKSRAREQGGAGLGLAICSEIMKRHHGRMDFDSEEGKGTTVHLYFKECVE